MNALTRRPRDIANGGTDVMNLIRETAVPDLEGDGEMEWERRREIYRIAAERVQQAVNTATWSAFSRTVVQGHPTEVVARELGKSVGAVYVARCRVMSRLRDAASQIQRELEE